MKILQLTPLIFYLFVNQLIFGQSMKIKLSANKSTICSGESINFTIVGTNRPDPYEYHIYDENGNQAGSAFASGNYTLTNVTETHTYHIRVLDKTVDPPTFITPYDYSDKLKITVFTPPSYTLSAPSTACLNSGNNVVYNFTVAPYRSSATYSLHYMDGSTEKAASGIFTNLGGGIFSYNITADIGGDNTNYFIKATENGCTVNSAQTTVQYRDTPTGIEETNPDGTKIHISTTDIPYGLNKLLKEANIPSGTTLDFDDHLPENDAVIKNSDGTYSFDPSRVSVADNYQVDYILTKDGCTARYLLAFSTFVVSEPSTNLPSFLKVQPPHTLIC